MQIEQRELDLQQGWDVATLLCLPPPGPPGRSLGRPWPCRHTPSMHLLMHLLGRAFLLAEGGKLGRAEESWAPDP
jgi:hypothetical protein